jgi:hypothetical protein
MRATIGKGVIGSGSWLLTFAWANMDLVKNIGITMSVIVGVLTGISVGLDIRKKWRARNDKSDQ